MGRGDEVERGKGWDGRGPAQVQSKENISCSPSLNFRTAQGDEMAEKLGVDADRDIH